MKSIFILNPKAGVVTHYTARGPGILARIELLDAILDAQNEVNAITSAAVEAGEEYADISEPVLRARSYATELLAQSHTN
jgi:hypothetical protein